MNKEIKERIETINKGKVPDGYIRTKAGLMPCDWIKSKPLTTNMIFENISDKNHGNEYPVLSATQEKGIVLRSEIEKDINFNKENTNSYKLVCKGDYVISLRSFQGGIEYSNIDGLVSPAYTVIRPIIPISDGYYKEYFKTNDFIDRLNSAIYGIRDGKQIGYKDFAELALHNPPLEEQEKIAEILSRCDKVIEECEKQVEEYKNLKKTCLSKMFPKKGSNVPEIRFPGFTDAWEQRKLGELAVFNPKEELPDVFEYVDLESVVGTEMLAHRTEEKATAPSRAQRLAHTGDLFYQTVRPYQKNNYLFEKPDKHYVFSTGYAQLRPFIDGYFLLSLVQNGQFVKTVLDDCTGTSYPAINANDLAEIEVFSPKDEQEHHQIGTYFRNLDNLITLHQRKVNAYTQMKKALTQLLLTGIVRVNKQQEISY